MYSEIPSLHLVEGTDWILTSYMLLMIVVEMGAPGGNTTQARSEHTKGSSPPGNRSQNLFTAKEQC